MINIPPTLRRAALALLLLAAFGVPLAYAQEVTTTDATTTDGTTTGGTTSEEAPPQLIAEGVTIGGVAVGGMTASDAAVAVRAAFVRPLLFTFGTRHPRATPREVGAGADVATAVANALAASSFQAVTLPVRVRAAPLRRYTAALARRFHRPAVNSRARLVGLRPVITAARAGWAIRRFSLAYRIRRALTANTRGPITIPSRVLLPRFTRRNFGAVIVIRRGSHRLYLYNGRHFWRTFGVAVGMAAYPTPLGRFYIASKQRNPWWYPPSSSWAAGASPIPPGPGNPLGTRWMGLSAGGVGIHGTPDSSSIGYSASHGCIRMRIPEAEWLFERVRLGTPVFIVSA